MIEHSPPFPLFIHYIVKSDSIIPTEDEEGIMDALRHRDRVRRIRLYIPVLNLEKVITVLEDEFPILEFLCVGPPTKLDTSLKLPESFRALHLRHLRLSNLVLPIGSQLLSTVVGLVTLLLAYFSPSGYIPSNDLIRRFSQMPLLEALGIAFHPPVPNRNVREKLSRNPLTTHATLPNLRSFGFKGTSAYLEALLPCMTAPLLAKLHVIFFNQLTFSLPRLQFLLSTTENMRFSISELIFLKDMVSMRLYPHRGSSIYGLRVDVLCQHFDWQVASAVQISSVLTSAFSTLESLTLRVVDWREGDSLEWHNEADRTQWRDLLRSFGNVKTLRVAASKSGVISQLSRSLQFEDGESHLELLPELKELSYPDHRGAGDAFTKFIDARRIAGHPVTLNKTFD